MKRPSLSTSHSRGRPTKTSPEERAREEVAREQHFALPLFGMILGKAMTGRRRENAGIVADRGGGPNRTPATARARVCGTGRMTRNSPAFGRTARGVEDAEDFDPVQLGPDTIWNDVACPGNHQLPSAMNAPGTAKGRVLPQETNGVGNALHQSPGGSGILSGNMLGFVIEIPQGRGEPPNLHRHPTFPARPSRGHRSRIPRCRLRQSRS